MLKMLSGTSFGLVLAASLSAAEIKGISQTADEASVGSADQLASPVVREHSDSGHSDVTDRLSIPAWQERGFVMDVVVATAEPAALELPKAEPISPDLEDMLKLHQAARSLEF